MRAPGSPGRKHSTFALVAAICFSAVNAQADPVAEAIRDCTPLMTLQKRQCEVEHVYRCAAPRAGYVVVTAEDGVAVGLEFTGLDGQIQGYQSVDEPGHMIVVETLREMSITTLRETDEAGFEVVIDFAFGAMDFDQVTATGTLMLDGGQTQISGQTFATGLAEMQITFPGAVGVLKSQWQMLLPEGEDVVLTAQSITSFGERLSHEDTAVMQVLTPSDDGFGIDQGLYDCGAPS